MQLFAGRKAVIFCNVTGWPLPTVKWLMNGMELKDGDLNISVSLKEAKNAESINSSLQFSEVDIRHAGFFSCEAKNKYLTRRRNIQVSVTCEGALVVIFCLVTHLSDRQINESVIKLSQMKIGKVTDGCQFSKFPHYDFLQFEVTNFGQLTFLVSDFFY